MRILQVIFSLTSGGGEKFTVDLCNELAKTNEVYLCVILSEKFKEHSFFKNSLSKNVHYINLNCVKGVNAKTFFNVFKLINLVKPEVIHFHLNTILYFYLPSIIYKNKIKFIHTLHSIPSKTIGFPWQKRFNEYFYKRKIINAVVISKKNKSLFENFYGNANVRLIENGVSKPKKTFQYEKVKQEVDGLKNGINDKVFIHIGGYLEAKNQKVLVNAFNDLIANGHEVILIIIGKYFDTIKGMELKNISRKGIHYLGTKTNISDYLLNSDVFVLSSLWEGLPISLLEAISCGVIPVCTPAGGIPDVIKSELVGFLSKDFTNEALQDAILNCLQNIDNFNRDLLKDVFKNNYSINICAKEYLKLYS